MNRRACTLGCTLMMVLVCMAVADAAPARPPREGYKPPDFTLKTPTGESFNLYDQIKKTSVVLVVLRGYPGYHCPACTAQMADFRKHADALAEANAHVVMVYPGAAADLEQHAAEFVKDAKLPANITLVLDPDYQVVSAYALRWDAPNETAYPAMFVIDRQRTIRLAVVSKEHGGRGKAADALKAVPGAK